MRPCNIEHVRPCMSARADLAHVEDRLANFGIAIGTCACGARGCSGRRYRWGRFFNDEFGEETNGDEPVIVLSQRCHCARRLLRAYKSCGPLFRTAPVFHRLRGGGSVGGGLHREVPVLAGSSEEKIPSCTTHSTAESSERGT